MKRLLFPFLTVLMIFIPVLGAAQTPPPRPVAVMPFTGEEDAVNAQFRSSVAAEIRNLPGNFPPSEQNLPAGMAPTDLPSDEPPPASMVGGRQYVVTGQSFPDEGEHHLQVWLWDVAEPTLVYTDELVCEEVEEAGEFMSLLIEWIFSHVPDPLSAEGDEGSGGDEGSAGNAPQMITLPPLPPEENVVTPRGQRASAPIFEDEDKWFYLGLRAGGSMRLYTADDNHIFNKNSNTFFLDEKSRLSPTFEGGVLAAVQLLPFLSLQGEALFTMDFTTFRGYVPNGSGGVDPLEVNIKSMGLMFPLILKVTLRPIPFLIAPFGGAYYMLGLGGLEMSSDYPGVTTTIGSYTRDFPLGWIAGATFGMKVAQLSKGAPGLIFVDVRYAADLGKIRYTGEDNGVPKEIKLFSRGMLSVTVGYEIGLVNRDIKMVGKK
jgi:hypothetical protein